MYSARHDSKMRVYSVRMALERQARLGAVGLTQMTCAERVCVKSAAGFGKRSASFLEALVWPRRTSKCNLCEMLELMLYIFKAIGLCLGRDGERDMVAFSSCTGWPAGRKKKQVEASAPRMN
jgi:hypothetical protein